MNNLLKACGILAALILNTTLGFAQQVEVGKANYYSDALQGNPTAYGEIYDRTQFTAAHRTYPKGTLLKVTRLDNSKSVIVRVNDRGPFSNDGALISLSMAAASLTDLTLVGNAQVKVEHAGYAETNAAAANYNTANGQNPNAFAFDRIYNGTPQEVPQDYFTPRGTSGTNTYNNQQAYNNQTTTQQPQYGPVPPSYDRRFQNRSGATYAGPNEAAIQAPAEYGYTGGNTSYNNLANTNATYNNNNANLTFTANPSASSVGNFPSLQAGSGFSVQVGAYSKLDNATRQAQSLVSLGLREIYLVQSAAANGTSSYRIFAGRFDNRDAAVVYAGQIKRQFLVNGFVLRL